MTTYRGAFHLHSHHSYDSRLSFRDLVNLLKQNGFSFAFMSEHAYHRAEKRFLLKSEFQSFIEDCRTLSSPDFLVIPGLEFACRNNQVHIVVTPLGQSFGLEGRDTAGEILEVARREGALAVLVHPFFAGAYRLLGEEEFRALDGFEIWNYRYQRLRGPSGIEYFKLRHWFKQFPRSRAFAGIDLHRKEDLGEIFIEMELEELKSESVFEKLRLRDYRLGALGRTFDPQGKIKSLFPHLFRREVDRVRKLVRRRVGAGS